MQVTIPFVNNLIVLDADGDRMLAKYYDGRSKPEQLKYEATLHKKSKNMTARSDGNCIHSHCAPIRGFHFLSFAFAFFVTICLLCSGDYFD